MQRIRITITDDHPLALSGIKALLQPFKELDVCAAYNSGQALLDGLKLTLPDVLLLDIMLPDISGQDLAAKIAKEHPTIRIVALSSIDAPGVVAAMMRRGCKAYLLKGADQDTLRTAIHEVFKGNEFIEPSLKDHLVKQLTGAKKSGGALPDISRREKEILTLIVAEFTTQEIADKLFISYRTVENHRYSLLQKLDVKNTAGLVRMALQLGICV